MQSWLVIADLLVLPLAVGYAEVPWYGNLLIGLWLWCFGANVGSFMNVVVYRLPLGRSVVRPRSRCPSCHTAIAWYDNIPVLSWLLLRARCRQCGVRISSRYPSVEASIAAMFLVVAFLAPITSGANLPRLADVPPLRLQTMFSVWLMYAWHMGLLCTLACAALIRYDSQLPPRRLFAPLLLGSLVVPQVWPQLRPVAFAAPVHWHEQLIAMADSAAGLAVGSSLVLIGYAVWLPRRPARVAWYGNEVLAGAAVGLVLGWQAAAALISAAAVMHLIALRAGDPFRILRRCPWTGHLWWLTILYIVGWRAVVERAPWLGTQASVVTFAAAAAVVSCATWMAAGLRRGPAPHRHQAEREGRAASFNISAPLAPTEEIRMPGDTSPTPDVQRILESPSYRLAESDPDFLARPALRPVRLQLELLKPEVILAEQGVHSTIVAFGGTQIVERHEAEYRLNAARQALAENPEDTSLQRAVARAERVLAKSHYYDAAREFGRLVSSSCQPAGEYVIITGGGPGIMEAANRGAYEVGAKSIGLNITLPEEQAPNPYITPELCFQFHYFALRKMHFLFRAKALVVFPGGFGTLDELFDALTLRQTHRMQKIPIILYGREYWDRVIDFQFMADEGVIRDDHLDLFNYAETPHEAWDIIVRFHENVERVP